MYLPLFVGLIGNRLIGVAHHGYEQVEHDDDDDNRVGAEHGQANEHGKRVLGVKRDEAVFFDQAEQGPKESL